MREKSPDESRAASRPGRLDTFVAPTPSPGLIRAMVPVNRVLCLGGTPILRDLPGLNALPGITGLSNVVEIDFPREDELRLRSAVNPHTAAFLAPNHPEFFTDWMLDKEVLSRVAPLAGCWATNFIVNGLGPTMQRFWLRNNLIAQIPGAGDAAKEHSIAWALTGAGVLLHPEGNVGWHGDYVAQLFPGVADMGVEAARRSAGQTPARTVHIAPIVWKLQFLSDADGALGREMAYVERKLGLGAPERGVTPMERVARAYELLLTRDETAAGITAMAGSPYGERQRALLDVLGKRVAASLDEQGVSHTADAPPSSDPAEAWSDLLRQAERTLRRLDGDSGDRDRTRRIVKDMRRILRFRPMLYSGDELTEEHAAENIKRLRYDYCAGTFRDTVNRFVPRPAGQRIARIRVPEPIDVGAALAAHGGDAEATSDHLVALTRERMQQAIDAIARAHPDAGVERRYGNPWQR